MTPKQRSSSLVPDPNVVCGITFKLISSEASLRRRLRFQHSAPAISSVSIVQRSMRWITRLFGCQHVQMSRPFSHKGVAYRSCLKCGAQRRFNLKSWQMQGGYYYGRPSTPSTTTTPNAAPAVLQHAIATGGVKERNLKIEAGVINRTSTSFLKK